MYVYKDAECKTIQSVDTISNNCLKENSNSRFKYSKSTCENIKDNNRGEV